MPDIPRLNALPTSYAGITFRSRAEARWAVFFQNIGIPWVYEPEGFDLGEAGNYLPDFWLPSIEAYFEVKGAPPDEAASEKVRALNAATGRSVFIASGGMPNEWDQFFPVDSVTGGDASGFQIEVWGSSFGWDNCQHFCRCPWCKRIGIEHEAKGERVCGPGRNAVCLSDDFDPTAYKERNGATPGFVAAYNAARSERFGT